MNIGSDNYTILVLKAYNNLIGDKYEHIYIL
jgi:hypothetical protein